MVVGKWSCEMSCDSLLFMKNHYFSSLTSFPSFLHIRRVLAPYIYLFFFHNLCFFKTITSSFAKFTVTCCDPLSYRCMFATLELSVELSFCENDFIFVLFMFSIYLFSFLWSVLTLPSHCFPYQ